MADLLKRNLHGVGFFSFGRWREQMDGIIYKAINKINGKVYIGQTTATLEHRICQHVLKRSGLFPKALKKYGKDGFLFETIDIGTTNNELDEKEIFWIKFFNCLSPHGYNLSAGGYVNRGYRWTDESREGIRGPRNLSKETRNKMSVSAQNVSQETRQKRSDSHLGLKPSRETRIKMSIAQSNQSEEKKKRISEALKGRQVSDETKAKISEVKQSHNRSEEYKLNIKAGWERRRVLKGILSVWSAAL